MDNSEYKSNNFPVSTKETESISQTADTQQKINQEFTKNLADKKIFINNNFDLVKSFSGWKNLINNFQSENLGETFFTKDINENTITLTKTIDEFDQLLINEWSDTGQTSYWKISASAFVEPESKQLITLATSLTNDRGWTTKKLALWRIEIIDNQNIKITGENKSILNILNFKIVGIKFRRINENFLNNKAVIENELMLESFKFDTSSLFKTLNITAKAFNSASTREIENNQQSNASLNQTNNLIVSDPSLESISGSSQTQNLINEEINNRLNNLAFSLENLLKLKDKINSLFDFNLSDKIFSNTELMTDISLSSDLTVDNKAEVKLDFNLNDYDELELKLFKDDTRYYFTIPISNNGDVMNNKTNKITNIIANSDYTSGQLKIEIVDNKTLNFYFEYILDSNQWSLNINGSSVK